MNRLTGDFFEILEERVKNELQCPACHNRKFIFSNTYLTCESCKTEYAIDEASRICSFSPALTMNKTKNEIMEWWGDLYEQC